MLLWEPFCMDVPDSLLKGAMPRKQARDLLELYVVKPLVRTINAIAVTGPTPVMLTMIS